MLGASVDFKFFDHRAAKFVTWKHALDCVFDNEFGLFGAHFAHAGVAFATHPARVKHVVFVSVLLASDLDLLGIDDDDEVTSVRVRRVGRLMATTEHVGNFYGYAAKCLIGSIDDEPGFGVVRFSS